MKAKLKKQIEILTDNNYILVFEATENLALKWVYYIIHDNKRDIYHAAYATNNSICIYNFRPFKEYTEAVKYITEAMNFYQ